MKIISHGAAREVTGSCHELQIGNKRILLDCGLFQGKRKEAAVKNSQFTFDPKTIDAMILSHAHMDHTGRIPLLYKKGYSGPIYCTYATQDLSHVMLLDSGYIQEKDEEYFKRHLLESDIYADGPLYTQKEAEECKSLFVGRNYGERFQVIPGVHCTFIEAGHILGAAMIYLEIEEDLVAAGDVAGSSLGGNKRATSNQSTSKRLIRFGFSGDLGRAMLPLIRDPQPMPDVTYLLCESTYGDRKHDDIQTAKQYLRDLIIKTASRGGKVLIPAFSLERTQEIVYDLHVLWDAKEIPPLPIIIDSPLANRVTEVFMKHPECYDKEMYDKFLGRAHNPFQFSLVNYTESVEESKALNSARGPMIIMAGSGMCEAGRIRHHLRNELDDPRNMVIAVGFMAENTLGRRIVDPEVKSVKIFDEMIPKKAEIHYINAYSGHADMDDLDRYIDSIPSLKKLILVHGEEPGMFALAKRSKAKRDIEVHMPEREQEIVL